jgi:mono/diheme cytochrome c family protein
MPRYGYRCLKITILALSLIVIFQRSSQAQPDGEALFKANCTACHLVSEDVVVGPGLKNVHTKYKEDWLIKWIKNSSALIKAGDPAAVKIYEQFNKVAMPAFNLSDDEVKAMIAYIKTESEKAPAAPAPGTPGATADAGAPKVIIFRPFFY